MATVFTIGYQGASLSSVVTTLASEGIEHVVDVRLTPISRKPGFSRSSLSTALQQRGISYSHWAELGCPKHIRVRYERTRDFDWYSGRYAAQVLRRQEPLISRLAEEATRRRTCLLCFEADASHCHRSLIACRAASVNQRGLAVSHLAVPSSARTRPAP